MQGTILQVNLSRGGLPKRPVPESFLTPLGFEGDCVAHPAVHGGPLKAVLIITSEGTDELIARGHPLFAGALGENLTTQGLDRHALRVGMRLRAGGAFLEITKLRKPCSALDVYGPGLQRDVFREDGGPEDPVWGLGGFYCSVVQPGLIRANDVILIVDAAV